MSESMKEKTRRLERTVKGKNAGKTDTFVFSEVRKMIELADKEARAEEREANGWQPIETAPKDGKNVDLWVNYDRIPDCSWLCGQWMAHGVDDFESPGYFAISGAPTHWLRYADPKDEVSE